MFTPKAESLSDLIQRQRVNIQLFHRQVNEFLVKHPEYRAAAETMPIDDLCALKYVESHEGHAYDKCIKAIEYRHKHLCQFQDCLTTSRPILEHLPHRILGFFGDVLVLEFKLGLMDFKRINTVFPTREDYILMDLCENERVRLLLDQQSRKVNRLCKVMVIMNGENGTVPSGAKTSILSTLEKVSAIKAFLFPQHVHMTVFYKPSAMIRMTLDMSRMFFSKHTMRKWKYCHGKGSNTKCPFVSDQRCLESFLLTL